MSRTFRETDLPVGSKGLSATAHVPFDARVSKHRSVDGGEVEWVLGYFLLFWNWLIRVGIDAEWAFLLMALLNLLAIFAFVGVFCAKHWMAKVALLAFFLAILAIPVMELNYVLAFAI